MPYETKHYTWISAATDIGIVVGVFLLARVPSRLVARALYRLTRHTGNDFVDLVVERVARLVPGFAAAVAFVRRVHVRFAEEGIEIPFPQRVVRLVGNSGLVPSPGSEA